MCRHHKILTYWKKTFNSFSANSLSIKISPKNAPSISREQWMGGHRHVISVQSRGGFLGLVQGQKPSNVPQQALAAPPRHSGGRGRKENLCQLGIACHQRFGGLTKKVAPRLDPELSLERQQGREREQLLALFGSLAWALSDQYP